jgi:hypothetical protein
MTPPKSPEAKARERIDADLGSVSKQSGDFGPAQHGQGDFGCGVEPEAQRRVPDAPVHVELDWTHLESPLIIGLVGERPEHQRRHPRDVDLPPMGVPRQA